MADLLHEIAALALGLFAGALLTEGVVLVPYWRKMQPSEFFRLHGEMGPSLFRYFAPLTIVAVLLITASAAVSFLAGDIPIGRVVAAFGALSTLLIFFGYFKRANQSFAQHTLTNDALPSELSHWAAWHWVRTAIIIIAFSSAILSL